MDPGAPAPGSYVKQCTWVLCQTVPFQGGLTYTVLYYTVVLYCTVQYSTCTVLYSTVLVDRHGDQGRHVLRHVRGAE